MEATIVLLDFASNAASKGLQKSLIKLGYNIDCQQGDVWLKRSIPYTNPTIAYIEPGTFDPAWMSRMTGRIDPGSLLAVIGRHGGRIQDSILDFVAEIAVWPCATEELGLRLRRIRQQAQFHTENKEDDGLHAFRRLNLIGTSPAFVNLLRVIEQILDCDATVLLKGETGTGKELVARALHYLGKRQNEPFIPVNCGAFPQDLLESELFGHEQGAFTDAKQRRPGLIEMAEGGTLFLDEVDALSAKGQVVVLRFLQDREYRPVGSKKIKSADVRLIAASNKDLKQCVTKGQFREDLYYRLCLIPIKLPPLRHRCEDIQLLARHFLQQYATKYDKGQVHFGVDALHWLCQQEWPGNVRELENTVHRACLMTKDCVIHSRHFKNLSDQLIETTRVDNNPDNTQLFAYAKSVAVDQFEKSYLRTLLKKTKGNISEAARRAGKERRTLGKLLKKHDIDRKEFS